jgi:hypothetical protein
LEPLLFQNSGGRVRDQLNSQDCLASDEGDKYQRQVNRADTKDTFVVPVFISRINAMRSINFGRLRHNPLLSIELCYFSEKNNPQRQITYI